MIIFFLFTSFQKYIQIHRYNLGGFIRDLIIIRMQSIQKTYQKLTHIEHVLLRPDTYIGSINESEEMLWILNADNQMQFVKIRYIPGLYKLFDEILVNAADNYQRDQKMSKIEVNVNENGIIQVLNDGRTIPIQIHQQHGIYVSQLVFGHLLTSSNYQDKQKKVTGGRNGFGAKITNIFSKIFKVQTADQKQKKIMTVQWTNNISVQKKPVIMPYKGKDYTKITFLPDFKRFSISNFSFDMLALLKKRVYDLAGIVKVKVYWQGILVPIKNFQDYVSLYVLQESDLIEDLQANSERWKVILTKSQGQFQQISFVNAIVTSKGGTHVNSIMEQIVDKITPIINKKFKDIQVKPFQIKAQFRIFVNCLIENPGFDSQTKQTLTTKPSSFGSQYKVSDALIKKIQKIGIIDQILMQLRSKANSKIDKQLKKIKNNRLIIPKLEDANFAGRTNRCILILTEGDSAKALAMSGIQNLGRDYYGIFPLRGKPLNSRDLTIKQVMGNSQLSNIVKIMGLSFEKIYDSVKSLRYGSVMIMTDQDTDGSHIKGLIINFFETFWPSLCSIPGFLKEFITPIIRCTKGNNKIDFFSQTDFRSWYLNYNEQWKIKYYKGLGTSTHSEAKQYFSNLQRHEIQFIYSDEQDKQSLNLAFNKKCANERKRWLQTFNPLINIDYNIKTIKMKDFINKQFIHYCHSDNIRSIASAVDGLKPSQRKILYGCFKRNLRGEIKVAQLAGYISQHSAYHHGQQSLYMTIIGMAQNFVGSNNLNLLQPIGQFGTRHLNGSDHASARYIFTSLNKLTRYIFNEADDHIVQYLEQDNMIIEPVFYLPIIPMILVNGCEGIGTGWSTNVYPHKVLDVIQLVKKRIQNQHYSINIGYEGFIGTISLSQNGSYLLKGVYDVQEDTINITEIPIRRSIRDYKSFLEEKVRSIENDDPDLEEIKQYHKNGQINFSITFIEDKKPLHHELDKYLKITSTLTENNMNLYDSKFKMHKYENIIDILQQFYLVRIQGYKKRKSYLTSRFQRQYQILTAKISFITEMIQGQFSMLQKHSQWVQKLVQKKYKRYSQLTKVKSTKKQEYQQTQDRNKDFNYLLNMPIWNCCQQKITQLKILQSQMSSLISYYNNISEKQLWLKDLNEFQNAWNEQNQVNNKNCTIKNKNNSLKRLNKSVRIQKDIKSEKKQISLNQENSKIKRKVKSEEKQVGNSIQDIISKYVKTSVKGDGLSFQERIKARISQGDELFLSSYNQTKKQLQVAKDNERIQFDFIDQQ